MIAVRCSKHMAFLTRSANIRRRCFSSPSELLPSQLIVASTRNWFDRVVIGEKLCPFAAPLLLGDKLRIVASSATTEQEAIVSIDKEVKLLMTDNVEDSCSEPTTPVSNSRHETTLVVFDVHPFLQNFRSFVRLSWSVQEQVLLANGLEREVQLVLFHPLATHQTYDCSDEDNPADYTIRSPYPTIHLLRELDVMRAVKSGYPKLNELPFRNKEKLTGQGLDACQRRLRECYSTFETEAKEN
jgi:uncharacterized protein